MVASCLGTNSNNKKDDYVAPFFSNQVQWKAEIWDQVCISQNISIILHILRYLIIQKIQKN